MPVGIDGTALRKIGYVDFALALTVACVTLPPCVMRRIRVLLTVSVCTVHAPKILTFDIIVTEGDARPVAADQVVTPVVSVASLIPEYGAAEGVKFDREENLCPDLAARLN